jgi:transposase-like protein
VVADAKRRTFSLDYKLRILTEAEAAKDQPGGVGALLRREGLYSSHLTTRRKEREAGIRPALTPKTRGPKSKRDPQQEELGQLRRENERLTEALRKAELIIEVQKKVGSLLGWPLPKTGSEEKL